MRGITKAINLKDPKRLPITKHREKLRFLAPLNDQIRRLEYINLRNPIKMRIARCDERDASADASGELERVISQQTMPELKLDGL